jgi:hypothetical protein
MPRFRRKGTSDYLILMPLFRFDVLKRFYGSECSGSNKASKEALALGSLPSQSAGARDGTGRGMPGMQSATIALRSFAITTIA